ncbi:multidrug efflux system membrane fusion protein [Pseudochelatococcus lubricantis]|uniref:Multidrug efflux system membrane fusion protein n=1 Tax=Pseudochelatococcus lubricantis TaxID=1538102 RepID=A0ABX0V0R7_9HYPH|nr:efflux RND transporter periplasmic adaptor subunit [Pseudochelatococcus lubricantis]NIJ58748.1 multidrug efflux system membrane fusion protein [Pseudochelatococcus lubricantis]
MELSPSNKNPDMPERRKPRRRGRWIVGILLLAIAGGGYAMRDRLIPGKPLPAKAATTPATIPITAVLAASRDLPISRSGLGTVTPLNQVDVKVRVDGQIQKIAFTEGQDVKAGDLLAEVDPRPYQAQLAQAQATLQKDMAQLANSRKEEGRATRLSTLGAGSSQASDTAKAQVAINEALIAGDQAAIDTAKLNLAFATVTAPIAGRAGLKQANEGAIIHANDAAGLVTITQLHPIAVQFSLPQDDLPDLLAGQAKAPLQVSVDSRDGSRHLADGKLTVIDSRVDTATGTIKLQAEFENLNNALWPGALVTARVIVRTDANATVVPSIAVQNGQKGPYVFVVKPDSTVAVTQVQTGETVGDFTALKAGISPGDNIVLSGQSRLTQGTRVSVTQSDISAQHLALEAKQ